MPQFPIADCSRSNCLPRRSCLKKAAAERFAKRDLDRLAFFRLEELVIHLKEVPQRPTSTETISRGYKVKVTHGRPDLLKGKERRQTMAMAALTARSAKRRGGPDPSTE